MLSCKIFIGLLSLSFLLLWSRSRSRSVYSLGTEMPANLAELGTLFDVRYELSGVRVLL